MAFSSIDTSVILLIAIVVADTSNFPSEFTVMVLYGLRGSASSHAYVTAALNLLLLSWWCPGSQLSSFLQSFLSTYVTTLASSSCSLGCMCMSRLFSEEGQGGSCGCPALALRCISAYVFYFLIKTFCCCFGTLLSSYTLQSLCAGTWTSQFCPEFCCSLLLTCLYSSWRRWYPEARGWDRGPSRPLVPPVS